MGGNMRKRGPPTPAPSATTSEISPAAPPAPPAPRAKIDKSGLYDLQQVKRLLDDELISFMEDQGYIEAVLVSNIKIVAGTAAVIAAVYSHFNPWEFPANRRLVLFCVLFYGVCIATINLASYVWEASAVYVGKLAPKARQVAKGTLALKIWVATQIGQKGSSAYKLELRTAPRQKGCVTVSHPYETYFTEEGRFLVDKFRADLTNALTQVDSAAKKAK